MGRTGSVQFGLLLSENNRKDQTRRDQGGRSGSNFVHDVTLSMTFCDKLVPVYLIRREAWMGETIPVSSSLDYLALSRSWQQHWPDCRPIGHELRGGDGWVRFHSLPESKRYSESESEEKEILRRHNTVIEELVVSSTRPVDSLAVVTCSWSGASDTGIRDDALVAVAPNATHWQSLLYEADADVGEESWTHLYVHVVPWKPGVLDDLLLLVADDQTADVIVGPIDWEWLYHPYDGGADVIVDSAQLRDQLRDRHRDWTSKHPQGL